MSENIVVELPEVTGCEKVVTLDKLAAYLVMNGGYRSFFY